jgi:hypothetical protein
MATTKKDDAAEVMGVQAGLDVTAYCDESEMTDSVYVVAGYVAPRADWDALAGPWTDALAAEGLAEFKMSACQGQDERQRRFLDIIAAHDLHACVSVIDLSAYYAVAEEMKRKRAPQYWKAYYLAFQQEVEMICTYKAVVELPTDERVSFMFDEQAEYQKRAQRLFDDVRRADPAHLGHWLNRLADLDYDESQLWPGLQAADALAYEAMRQFRDVVFSDQPQPIRWQWRALSDRGKFCCRVFNAPAIAELLRRMPDRDEA